MKTKKAIAVLLGMTLAVPAAAMQSFAAEAAAAPSAETAVQPAEILTGQSSAAKLYFDDVLTAKTSGGTPVVEADTELPAKVDMRELGTVTSVKNQGSWGTCWAHAALSCIESRFVSDDPTIDLAERYLAYYMDSAEFGSGTNSSVDGSTPGNISGLFTNWIGIAPEYKAPYDETYTSDLSRSEVQDESEYHVTGVHILDFNEEMDDREESILCAKKQVSEGNALYLGMNFDSLNGVNPETNAYYSPEIIVDASHAISIVGYDDNYPAENFRTPPPTDGAWLIKNSWGLDEGDNGYYWVSYDEPSIMYIIYFDVTDAKMHDQLYAYDDFGATGKYAFNEAGDETAYSSNVFTAGKGCFVTDAMLICSAAGDSYEVTVYTDLEDAAVPTSGTAQATASGVFDTVGYHTVKLSQPVHVEEGEQFAVVAKVSGETDYRIICEMGFNFDETEELAAGNVISSFETYCSYTSDNYELISRTFGAGQSFVSADGEDWLDMYDFWDDFDYMKAGNVCIKAIAVDDDKVHFSTYAPLVPGEEIELSCCDSRDIYYSIDGGDYQLYTAPVVFTGDMTLSAYVEGHEDIIETHYFTEKSASVSSILVESYSDKFYADLVNFTDIVVNAMCESISITPIATGNIVFNSETYGSYQKIDVSVAVKPVTYIVAAVMDGLRTTEFTLTVRRQYLEHFTGGYWTSAFEKVWYEFSDEENTGIRIDRITGETSDFTYTVAGNRITLDFGGIVREGDIASDDISAVIEWDGGTEEILSNCMTDGRPGYTSPELADLAETYYTAYFGSDADVEITNAEDLYVTQLLVTANDGTSISLIANDSNGVATDDSGNVVNLTRPPVKNEHTSFKPGVWRLPNGYGAPKYYCFSEDSDEVTVIGGYDAYSETYTYDLAGDQFTVHYPYDYSDRACIELGEEYALLSWQSGFIEEMVYVSDATAETFFFYTENALRELAKEYYLGKTCVNMPFDYCSYNSDGTVTVWSMYIYSDADTEGIPNYTVDVFTACGYDENGEPVDLTSPVYCSDTAIPSGMWKATSQYGTYDGHYWFSADGYSAAYRGENGGEDIRFTYRIVGPNGVAVFEDGTESFFSYINEDGMITLSWWDGFMPGSFETNDLTYISSKTMDKFVYYTVDRLVDEALVDFNKRHVNDAEYSLCYYNEDGTATVLMIVDGELESDVIGSYTIDPYTGKGTDQDGSSVNLPKTGIPSYVPAVAAGSAAVLILAGLWLVMMSVRSRKEEKAL